MKVRDTINCTNADDFTQFDVQMTHFI